MLRGGGEERNKEVFFLKINIYFLGSRRVGFLITRDVGVNTCARLAPTPPVSVLCPPVNTNADDEDGVVLSKGAGPFLDGVIVGSPPPNVNGDGLHVAPVLEPNANDGSVLSGADVCGSDEFDWPNWNGRGRWFVDVVDELVEEEPNANGVDDEVVELVVDVVEPNVNGLFSDVLES